MTLTKTPIPTGLVINSQIPLDNKLYFLNEASLSNLGELDSFAFTYYKGMVTYCAQEDTSYKWKEIQEDEEGLLNNNFIYPDNWIKEGIDYSNKAYNFVLISTASDGSETKIIAGTNTTVSGSGTVASPYVINSTDTVANGSETKINAGTNVTIIGNGTTATPYIINSTASEGGNQGIQDVIQTDPVINTEASILLSPGSSWSVKGEAQGGYEERSPWLKLDSFVTLADPYDNSATVEIGISNEANDELFKGFRINENSDIEIVAFNFNQGLVYSTDTIYNKYFNENTVIPRWYLNQQREIAGSTNLSIYDHDNTIYVGNGANDITITVDSTHGVSNFEAGFIQTGTGTVTFVPGPGVTLLSPTGYKIKGQNYQAFLIRKGNTNTYNLLGNIVA